MTIRPQPKLFGNKTGFNRECCDRGEGHIQTYSTLVSMSGKFVLRTLSLFENPVPLSLA